MSFVLYTVSFLIAVSHFACASNGDNEAFKSRVAGYYHRALAGESADIKMLAGIFAQGRYPYSLMDPKVLTIAGKYAANNDDPAFQRFYHDICMLHNAKNGCNSSANYVFEQHRRGNKYYVNDSTVCSFVAYCASVYAKYKESIKKEFLLKFSGSCISGSTEINLAYMKDLISRGVILDDQDLAGFSFMEMHLKKVSALQEKVVRQLIGYRNGYIPRHSLEAFSKEERIFIDTYKSAFTFLNTVCTELEGLLHVGERQLS